LNADKASPLSFPLENGIGVTNVFVEYQLSRNGYKTGALGAPHLLKQVGALAGGIHPGRNPPPCQPPLMRILSVKQISSSGQVSTEAST